MRSKSEVIVYEVLKRCGLSPHYEERLYAADGSGDYRLPDFTIRHGGRTWYWEHLGMLSKQSYKDDWENKVNWYRKNGYYDSVLTSRDHLIGNSSAIHADEIRETALKYILK